MNLDPVKAFLARTKGAVASKALEVRMTTQDAQALALALGELMALAINTQTNQTPTTIKVNVDGGVLKQ